jgi:hypothetical protein
VTDCPERTGPLLSLVDGGMDTLLASPGRKSSPQRQQTPDANHSNNNKAADHGERIVVDSQHTAPHRDIASNQRDCRRLGSKFLWLSCNDPVFYCGKEMAETGVTLGFISRDQAREYRRAVGYVDRILKEQTCRFRRRPGTNW